MDAVHRYLRSLEQRAWLQSRDVPAAEEDFQSLEALLGQALPESFKILYRRLNGQPAQALPAAEPRWLSLAEMLPRQRQWQDFLQANGAESWPDACCAGDYYVRGGLFSPRWLPFMEDEDGSLYCLDFAPAAQGRAGQVIFVAMGSTWQDYDVLYEAPDFTRWLADLNPSEGEEETPSLAVLCTDYFHFLWQRQAPLNPPVRPAAWAWLAQQFSPLPAALQQLYALFDGMAAAAFEPPLRWLPLAEMQRWQRQWQQQSQADPRLAFQDEGGRIQACPFHPRWLPFLSWDGLIFALDFAPTAAGHLAQIIRMEYRAEDGFSLQWEGANFEEWLEQHFGQACQEALSDPDGSET